MGASALKKIGTVFAIACGLPLAMVVDVVAQSVPQAPAPRLALVTGSRPPGVAAIGLAGPEALLAPCRPVPAAPVADLEPATHVKVRGSYGKLPLSFEANQGQSHGPVKFLARGRGYTLFLTPTEAVVVLHQPRPPASQPMSRGSRPARVGGGGGESKQTSAGVVRMHLVGADPAAQVTGLEELPGKVHYFLGKDPTGWRTNIPIYAKVWYRDVYPGVDLFYYGHHSQVEYDFVVAPGADPRAIRFGVYGANTLELTPQSDLLLHTATGALRLHRPLVYQEVGGVKQAIPSWYVFLLLPVEKDRCRGVHHVGVHVAAYDPSKPLIIDPVLSYSTYLGGLGDERGSGIAVDAAGSAYVTGETSSLDFPTANPFQPALGGGTDAFVSKLTPDGSALVYSTYLGGSGVDRGFAIAVDAAGAAYVTGETASPDFPTANPFQALLRGRSSAFVTKLTPDGSALVYSTYLGGSERTLVGSGLDTGRGIAVDAAGAAYVTGETSSTNFPTKNPLKATLGTLDPSDAFMTKLTPDGSALVYSTYLGGSGADRGFAIAVDAAGAAYVTGETRSTNFPTKNPFQAALSKGATETSPTDAFVTKIDPSRVGAASLVYSTYLGGTNFDTGRGIAVDAAGAAYVTGYTIARDFPMMNPLQAEFRGCSDAFMTKLTPDGSALVYSTYLGGSGADRGFAIAVDAAGAAYVTGETSSLDFPTANPFQPALGGGTDAFVTKLTPDGSALVYSTYLGGSGVDRGFAIAVDAAGAAYVTGRTRSPDFPTASAVQPAVGGGSDAFITKIGP